MQFLVYVASIFEQVHHIAYAEALERQRQTRKILDANTDSETDTDSEPDHSDVDDDAITAGQPTS